MTPTPNVVYKPPESMNIGGMITSQLLDAARNFWYSLPISKVPHEVWIFCGALILVYFVVWFWLNFIR